VIKLIQGDALALLKTLKPNTINTCITSPPYWGLRDYGVEGQLGLEKSPQEYVANLVEIFSEVRRVLRDDGTLWLNLGDSYSGSGKGGNPENSPHKKQRTNVGSLSVIGNTARKAAVTKFAGDERVASGLKPKDLVGIPWRVAFALQADGWYLRSAIIWAKPNGMPGSQIDRCTSSYEMIFQFSKAPKYWSDFDAIKTPPRESTLARLAQDVQAQAGSHRANAGAKTNGPMKAVAGAKLDKQRGHGRRHAGFNERWDAMERSEQQSQPAAMRDVWFIAPKGFKGAHFAVFPEEVPRRCILAGCPEQGIILDPFAGSGTVGLVANNLNRHAILFELNPAYIEIAKRRCGL
jgi:DNA modification methylase